LRKTTSFTDAFIVAQKIGRIPDPTESFGRNSRRGMIRLGAAFKSAEFLSHRYVVLSEPDGTGNASFRATLAGG